MKWLKKLAGDFSGAAQDEAAPTPAPAPVAPVQPQPVALTAPPVPKVPQPVKSSVEDFVKARADFFTALKTNDDATINRIAADYPGEAMDWRSDEGTPLAIAQKSGSLQSFKAVLALGADKEETYAGRDFPLHYAQTNGQKDFFAFLLEAGADIERVFTNATFNGSSTETTTHTALGTAILLGNEEAAIALMQRGASVTAPYTYQRASLMLHSSPKPPQPQTAVEYATSQKQFLIADIAKRAHILQSDYLVRQTTLAAPQPQAPEPDPAQTAEDIGVMQPLRLKKTPGMDT